MMYHGTPYHRRVMQEGLIPNEQRNFETSWEGYVYLAFTPEYAFGYTSIEGRVLEVDVPEDRVIPDPDSPAGMYEGRIPPSQISYLFDSRPQERARFESYSPEIVSEDDAIELTTEVPAVERMKCEHEESPFTEAADGL